MLVHTRVRTYSICAYTCTCTCTRANTCLRACVRVQLPDNLPDEEHDKALRKLKESESIKEVSTRSCLVSTSPSKG